jgi:hypothetical protein
MTKSPFANLPQLPCDVAEALEELKLSIVRHRAHDWELVKQSTMSQVCNSLQAYVEGEPTSKLERISEALDAYHQELTDRKDAWAAASHFTHACQDILGKHWKG